jgi:hypothetical protein
MFRATTILTPAAILTQEELAIWQRELERGRLGPTAEEQSESLRERERRRRDRRIRDEVWGQGRATARPGKEESHWFADAVEAALSPGAERIAPYTNPAVKKAGEFIDEGNRLAAEAAEKGIEEFEEGTSGLATIGGAGIRVLATVAGVDDELAEWAVDELSTKITEAKLHSLTGTYAEEFAVAKLEAFVKGFASPGATLVSLAKARLAVITESPDLAAAAADGDLEAWATLRE